MTLLHKLAALAVLLAGLYVAHAWDKSRAVSAAYAAGQAETQARWNKERIEQQALALLAERQARAEEQAKVEAAQEAMNAHRKQAQRDRAARDAARSELDLLRDELAARDTAARGREAGSGTGAKQGTNAEPGVERELLATCAAEYQSMAAEADGIRTQLLGLQGWVRAIGASLE